MKEEIIQTSLNLFAQKGYEETSISDILTELQISRGGLYHHFQSKEDILVAIAETFANNISEKLNRQMESLKTATINKKIESVTKAKTNLDPELQAVLSQLLTTNDPKIIDLLMKTLRTQIVPLIQELFFSNITKKAEAIAKAHLLFSLTQLPIYLPTEVQQEKAVAKKFGDVLEDLITEVAG